MTRQSLTDWFHCMRLPRYARNDVNSELIRDSLVEVSRIDGTPGTHNGACATFPGLQGGILLSQFEPASSAQTFKIYKSQVSLP